MSSPASSHRAARRLWHVWSAGALMSKYFPTPQECGAHTIFPGVHIRTAALEKMMISVVDLEPHSVVEEHAHPHEQVGILLSGRVTFFIGDEQKVLGPGDTWIIPG